MTRTMVLQDPRDGSTMEVEVNIPAGTDTGDMVQSQLNMPGRRGQPITIRIPIEVRQACRHACMHQRQ